MFQHLKKKLEQGVAQSKAVVSGFTKGDDSSENNTSSDSLGKPVAQSTPLKDVKKVPPVEDFSSPVFPGVQKSRGALSVTTGQLANVPFSDASGSSPYETVSDIDSFQEEETPKENRSRTSSINSMASDSNFFPNFSLPHSFSLASDNESEMEETSLNLSTVSKEDLYAFIKRFEQRAFKYKSKFLELGTAYKDLFQEKEKLKSTLTQCQDGALRRVSELREQIQLDQLAKRDLEEKYRLFLEEKDEHTKVLLMQVKLLKEGKEIPEELETKLSSTQVKTEASLPIVGDTRQENSSTNDEIELLKSKIKRQDGLLQKCKDTITSYKEKISQLSQDKDDLQGKLELMSKVSDKANNPTPNQISRLQTQIQEARKVIEQLESDREVAIAEVKQQVHEEMEKKDAELELVKGQHQKFLAENNNLKLKIEKMSNETEELRRINQEQLEKARNIMRKLKEDKVLAVEQAETRIRQAEQSMEEEKEKMLIDLKRGKAEAFSVMQHESEKNLAQKVEAAVEERDKFWNKKMAAQEQVHTEVLRSKDREKEMAVTTIQEEVRRRLKEKEEDVRLSLEERELQKMAAVTGLDEQKDRLLLQIEELSSEKIELSNRFSKFQEDTEHQILELKDRLNQMEAEHKKVVDDLQMSHEEALKREKDILIQKVTEEIELIKQRHAEMVQNLIDKQEQDLQESNTELENYYKSQMESDKDKLQNLLAMTKDQLEEMRNCYSLNQTKLMETEQQLAKAKAELENRRRDHGLNVEIDLTRPVNQTFSGSEGQELNDTENSADIQIKTLEGKNSELRIMCDTLSEDLKSVAGEVAAAKNELRGLKVEKCAVKEDFQQQLSLSGPEREKSDSQSVQELREGIIQMNEEHEGLERNVENSRIKVEELEKSLEEARKEKATTESKAREFEIQVGQLQEVIRTLESCQSTVEREKASLEQKLTSLENIVEDLKVSKEELNEKLHGRHEALIHQSAEVKKVLEIRASEFALQVDVLKEEVDTLNMSLLSKHDENIALRSVVDDSTKFAKSLEDKVEKLTAELQIKSQTSSHSEAALAKSLEKFEKLKNEANAKVKGLKEIKDSLTEHLNKQQTECEEMRCSFMLEKNSLIQTYEEKLSKQQEEMKALEQTFREQFDQRQAKFKEAVIKLKERQENKLKEKDKQLEDYIKELTSQKDLGVEDLTKNLEKLKEEQLKHHEQKHQMAVYDMTAEWEARLQASSDSNNQELEATRLQYQQQLSDLQQKLSDKDSLIHELSSARDQLADVKIEFDKLKLQMEGVSKRHSADTATLNLQLEKDVQIEHLLDGSESLHQQSLESQQQESLTSQIRTLTELLQEKDTKLEAMAGTISAEQEHLYKQLAQKTKITEELQNQKNDLSAQLTEAVEKYGAQLQKKDALLNNVSQKIVLLEVEHALLKEMLTTGDDTSLEKETVARSLQEHLEQFKTEHDAKMHDLESQLETKSNGLTVLEEELKQLRYHYEQVEAELIQNHANETDIVKLGCDSRITELQTETQALKSHLTEANEKLQNCVESYENRLADERSKLVNQEASLNEQINVLKQQLHEIQSQPDVSSSLLVGKGEEKPIIQLELHQKEIESTKQEAEQKMKNLKQKYITKLKEIQNQAKSTIEVLENTIQDEKAAKSDMYAELTRANTRLLQFEEHSGTSRDTIVDLEHKVVDMTAMMVAKDNELTKLKADVVESEKNKQDILDEAQANYKQINDNLIETKAKLKDNESDLQSINNQLQEKLALMEQTETIIKSLESMCSELARASNQEKEKNELEVKERSSRCLELEDLLEKSQNQLCDAQSKCTELDYKAQSLCSAFAELEKAQEEKQHIQTELSQLSVERDELKFKLLETERAFEKSLKEHASLIDELNSKLSESESEKKQISQDHKAVLNQLQQTHAAELSELSSSMEVLGSSKVAEYKKEAEVFISEVKKQLQDDHSVLLDKQQENMIKLEETITTLTDEINELKQAKEKLIADNDNIIQNLKSQFYQEIKLKQSLIEDCDQKEKEFHQSESSLKKEIDSLLSEKDFLLEKLSEIEKIGENGNVQSATEIEELKLKNRELYKNFESFKSDKDTEILTLKAQLEDTMEKQLRACDTREAVDKSELGKPDLIQEHHSILNELKKEISERDKHIKELHVESQAKIQMCQNEQDKKLNELQSELASTKRDHQQEVKALETKLKFEHLKNNQSRESTHYQELIALTQEWNGRNQESVQENQTSLSAIQRGAADDSMLQEQVTLLIRQMEQMREQHKRELTEIHSSREIALNSLPQPLIAAPLRLNMDVLDPNFSADLQNLELQNMDLQAQVSQLHGELSLFKIKERDLLRKMEKLEHGRKSVSDDDDPPLSLDGSYMNHNDSAIFREPTEFEYLRNILYEYMMGRETKTLAKVIATVVKFSDEQMRNVLAKADNKLGRNS